MKAITFKQYGSADVLEMRDVDVPGIADDEVLVQVRAASLNPQDWHVMTGLPLFLRLQSGLRHPKVTGMGSDFAGRIEAVGRDVTTVRPGDEVYGRVDDVPGTRLPQLGAVAEFVRVSADAVRPRPAGLSAEEAAAVPLAAVTALQGLRAGELESGQHVLINGASGGVGTFAVQIAKAFGAEVTGVCSTRNLELVRSLGADHVVDYTREDFTAVDHRFDLVLDNVGNHSLAAYRRILRPTGTYLSSFDHPGNRLSGPMPFIVRMMLFGLLVRQRMKPLLLTRNNDDLETITELIEAGKVTPVIDRTYPIVETREAMAYLATRRARGKVVVTI